MRAAVLAGLLLFPLMAPTQYVSLGFVALQSALLALGLNIVLGWTGLLDLGAAGFVAVGAYATAICATQLAWPPLVVLCAALIIGFFAGVLLGIPTLRHRADYFAILTLGFAELVALTVRNWPAVTGGPYGYSGIPPTRLPFVNEPLRAYPPIGFYYFALSVVVPAYFGVIWLRSTAWGRHCHVVKHSETVARCYGINVIGVKLLAFALSAALLGAGGFFLASYQRSIVWSEFGVLLSCLILSLVIVGGVGSPRGAIAGAALVGTSLELLRRLLTEYDLPQDIRYLLFALALVVFVHLRPRGLLPDRPRWLADRSNNSVLPSPSPMSVPAATSGAFLEVENLHRSFGAVVALDGVSLKVQPKECVALVGPNGSGKTTLINVVSGLLRPDRGAVRLDGQRIDRWSTTRIARAGVRRSFQDVSVFHDISVRDNVLLTVDVATAQQVQAAHVRFGLTDGDVMCENLSYGARKALDLARLFVHPDRLRLVLLDEPTAGLSEGEAMELVGTLLQLRDQTGVTMVVVSHDIMFLHALKVDRVIVLNEGRVLREGQFESVRHDPEVMRLFWGEEITQP